jgi:hypothetical protein
MISLGKIKRAIQLEKQPGWIKKELQVEHTD